MKKDFSVFATVSAITAATLYVGLYTGIIKFTYIAWMLIFWAQWGFAAFICGGLLVLGALIGRDLYDRVK